VTRNELLEIANTVYTNGGATERELVFAQTVAHAAAAEERSRLEKAVRELAPLKDLALLQDKPAAFWIEAFAKIVRGET